MTYDPDKTLAALGVALPVPAKPVASYVSYNVAAGMVFISGQLPLVDGKVLHPGRVGDGVSLEQAQEAARASAINILAQTKAAVEGDWSRVRRCVRLGGFIASPPDYVDHAKIMNGASDLIGEVLGERGRHARTTIGVSSLPLGAAVEVEALFEIGE